MSTSQQHQPSPTVRYEVRDRVAVIRLANPPVNGLGDTVRAGLTSAVARAAADDHVGAVIVVGEGKGFCGGADLRQFGTPAATADPTLPDVLTTITHSPKPVIAAIHGFALGGGLELALACHYRITHRDAKLGLPEVNVGLIPGSGGTQRLPRLIGAAAALRLIQQGTPVSGARAAELGIADDCFDGDPLGAAHDFLRTQVNTSVSGPVVDSLPPADAAGVDFDAARRTVRPSTRNGLAQLTAIDAVETATRLPTAAGLAFERAAFLGLLRGPESAALRHVFFAEKTAPRLSGVPPVSARPISRVAVVGAGTMGSGIAMAFANGGLPVTLIEQNQDALTRGTALVRKTYESSTAKGRLTETQARDRIALIEPNLDLDAAAEADLVVEAVFEDMGVKKEVFSKLDALCKPGAILASNTSRLDLDEIARATSRPSDVIGLHFFSPANIMKLVEVVRGEATADDVVATGLTLAQQIGKIPVLSQVCEGFIGNRMLTPYRREAEFLLEEGATPQQIDAALQAFGMAMGPCAMSDLAGLDIAWAARKRLAPTRPKDVRYSRVADTLCENGRFGQKSGAGYYRYEKGSRTPVPDPAVDEIIRTCAAEDGIERRTITDEEIIDRCVLALVNEGATLLGEGIAQRASDIDVVYVDGYGFPAFRGGPMYYAEALGLDVTLQKIRDFENLHGRTWTPAPLLAQLVDAGRTSF
ncbi:3-hydroxyacyl-CoA dehydrogenase NAD-binding domain-containing protein [Rhodococcus opacus]|uniref:3-hydroxyacyl-CoA dehydrogenase NAD-binding domain-containing protein n=1 Tax=Rhodococcus opacus TaxID=37919 RepID=UPI002235EF7A|nr:3-hydroxyacyl-CoA dehydrogenase NAD-binding domain-containing protein [Rhodococcus opacus]UZG55436.1 3-hydroxyacyl-CoA dehydrogenase NAD-binding domain-containing protein [Rhodococcus opacus]